MKLLIVSALVLVASAVTFADRSREFNRTLDNLQLQDAVIGNLKKNNSKVCLLVAQKSVCPRKSTVDANSALVGLPDHTNLKALVLIHIHLPCTT